MNLATLLEIVNARYPDDLIVKHWNASRYRPVGSSRGDTLALFIVNELHETFDASATDTTQLETAIRAMERAIIELDHVKTGLMAEFLKRRDLPPQNPAGGAPQP